jgi:uncharacterized protein
MRSLAINFSNCSPRTLRASLHSDFVSHQMFYRRWCLLYAVLPVAIAGLLDQAAKADPEQLGNWRDAIILLILGLAIDLRWLERAWPSGLAGLGKLLPVDAALYGFVAIRQLRGTGFDFIFAGATGRPDCASWPFSRQWF